MPDIDDILDAYIAMKGGPKNGKQRPSPAMPDAVGVSGTEQERAAQERGATTALSRENAEAKRNMKHISTQPLFIQQQAAMARKMRDKKK